MKLRRRILHKDAINFPKHHDSHSNKLKSMHDISLFIKPILAKSIRWYKDHTVRTILLRQHISHETIHNRLHNNIARNRPNKTANAVSQLLRSEASQHTSRSCCATVYKHEYNVHYYSACKPDECQILIFMHFMMVIYSHVVSHACNCKEIAPGYMLVKQ